MQRDLGAGYSFERKPCFVCGSLNHLIKNCDYHEKKMAREAALKSTRVVHAKVRQTTPAWTNWQEKMLLRAKGWFMLMLGKPHQSGLILTWVNVNTARVNFNIARVSVNTGHGNVNSVSSAGTHIKSGSSRFNTGKHNFNSGSVHFNTARVNQSASNQTSQVNFKNPKQCFSKQSSPVTRPFSRNTAYKSHKYAVKGKVGTAVKTSAGCVWRTTIPLSNTNSGPIPDSNDHPLKHMEHRGIFDSGCSGHMTGNRAHLEDYQELSKEGSVTFGGSKGSISGKGTIRLGNLVFDDVAFVKELGHFNLFSISQICDKKLNVLFTEKECFVVSSDFKMPDENQIFLESDIVWESRKEIIVSPHPRKATPLVLSCQRDPESPALSLINQDLLYLKKGSSGSKKIVLSLHKFLAVIFNEDDIEERTSKWVNKCVKKFNPYARYGVEHWKNPHAKIFYIRKQKEPGKAKEVVYSNSKIIQVIKTYWELGHEHKFITEIVARRANECIVSITEPDFKNLNKNDIEDMYLLIMNGKVLDYAETGLLWSLSVLIKSSVIWERVHDFQLGIESYQQKVNLTAPTISFPGIEKHKIFSIIHEPVYGIIYKNSKKEKRVMRHSKIHKFCDATLNMVLKGLKSYKNDVKYGYIQR
ncbi:hypothetical protein Tco_0296534, partial [Tanacetum coccineum]